STLRCLPGLHVPRWRGMLQPDWREPLDPQMPTVRRSDRAGGCWSPLRPFSAKERAPRGRTGAVNEFTTAICGKECGVEPDAIWSVAITHLHHRCATRSR